MLQQRLDTDFKDAMRSRDPARLRTLRSIRAALKQKEIEGRSGGEKKIDEGDIVAVLQKQAKQRRDSIEQFRTANRPDLVKNEEEELEIIESYLPALLSENEIRDMVKEIVQEVGAQSISDIGKVMGPAMSRLRGKADGRIVNQIVRELLTGD